MKRMYFISIKYEPNWEYLLLNECGWIFLFLFGREQHEPHHKNHILRSQPLNWKSIVPQTFRCNAFSLCSELSSFEYTSFSSTFTEWLWNLFCRCEKKKVKNERDKMREKFDETSIETCTYSVVTIIEGIYCFRRLLRTIDNLTAFMLTCPCFTPFIWLNHRRHNKKSNILNPI